MGGFHFTEAAGFDFTRGVAEDFTFCVSKIFHTSFAYGDLQGLDDFSRSGKSSSAALRRCPERPCAPAKSLGRFRFDREKTRKAEISRDFSAFFAPNFFRISIDPFSIFFRVEGFELPKTQFFQNFITNESNTKDLNPRQGLGLFRFLR